jgi:hypothetical protein
MEMDTPGILGKERASHAVSGILAALAAVLKDEALSELAAVYHHGRKLHYQTRRNSE